MKHSYNGRRVYISVCLGSVQRMTSCVCYTLMTLHKQCFTTCLGTTTLLYGGIKFKYAKKGLTEGHQGPANTFIYIIYIWQTLCC